MYIWSWFVVQRNKFVLMHNKRLLRLLFTTLSPVLVSFCFAENETQRVVRVGVILDWDSSVGNLAKDYISVALSDFYAKHENYQTRLDPTMKDSENDVVVAASAGDLIFRSLMMIMHLICLSLNMCSSDFLYK